MIKVRIELKLKLSKTEIQCTSTKDRNIFKRTLQKFPATDAIYEKFPKR